MLASTMDDLTQHRKRRLRALIDGKPFLGNQAAFAVSAGLSKGRITQLLSPQEAFGERSGMKMAAALGMKDERYFEREAAATVPPPSRGGAEQKADALLHALNVLASAISNADELTRLSIEPLLSRLAHRPQESGTIAQRIYEELRDRTRGPAKRETEHAGQLFDLGMEETSAKRISTATKGGRKAS